MKTLNKYIIGLFAVAALTQSCKKDFIAINTNPNVLSDALPQYLFSGATIDLDEQGRGQLIARYKFMVFMQYIVPDGDNANLGANFCNPSTATGPDAGVNYYQDYFTGIGADMHRIIDKIDGLPDAQKATYSNLRAICVILDTYHAWRTIDLYGAIPYAQAFQINKYPNPAYDYDYNLYKTFDAQLKSAAAVLNSNLPGQVALGNQDFFYGGKTDSWEAFANTLRIKIALRYEKRDNANLKAVLNDIQTNFGSKIISSLDQSFGVNHSKNYDTDTDDIDAILTTYDASYAFVEFLKSTSDPRLALMVRQNDMGANSAAYNTVLAGADAAGQTFLAQPANKVRYYGKHAFPASQDPAYGLTGAGRFYSFTVGTNAVSLDYLSFIQGRYFVRDGAFNGNIHTGANQALRHTDEVFHDDLSTIPMRTLWLSYGETCFMMAELAQKGYNGLGGSASDWYNAGVKASFDQYSKVGNTVGVTNASNITIGDYLSRYPYNGLTSIYSQAWVHLMTEPEEAYALWKRTGYPQFADFRAGQASTIGDGSGVAYLEGLYNGTTNLLIPRRMHFATDIAGNTLNSTNLFNALSAMMAKDPAYGASGLDTKGRIWWDQK